MFEYTPRPDLDPYLEARFNAKFYPMKTDQPQIHLTNKITEPDRPVIEQAKALNESCGMLNISINALEKRLAPVLSVLPEADEKERPPSEGFAAPLADELYKTNCTLGRIIIHINNITERLGV